MTASGTAYRTLIDESLSPLIPEGAPIALFDFPTHSNVGDSAIWLGEVSFLKNHRKSKIILCDSQTSSDNFPELPPETIIFIHGGGNFGDLWPHHHLFRLKIVNSYVGHRIVQFPQSIYFEHEASFEQTRKALSLHPDFHLFTRDEKSFSFAKKLYAGHCALCPDMALYLKRLQRPPTKIRWEILALMRTDKEKQTAINAVSADGVKIVDWIHEPRFLLKTTNRIIQRYARALPIDQNLVYRYNHKIFNALATHRLNRGCELISSGSVVITDRLHAHILCVMMNIPHVVLDNSYQKIGLFRDAWRTGAGICESASSFEDALILARRMIVASATPRPPE